MALVDPKTFEPLPKLTRRGLLIAGVRIGGTHLIDNLAIAPRAGGR